MLNICSVDNFEDVTVYADDAIWYQFYPVPKTAAIRRDDRGQPVFLLSLFHISDQDREAKPDLPRGGGYMNFDVCFEVDADKRARLLQRQQLWVDGEYERRRADPAFAGNPDYAGAAPPTARLVDPMLSGGTVKMLTTQSNLLVSGKFAEMPASLVSGSTAVFNMDLTENGASYMKSLFITEQGAGRIDLSPVQVIYDLHMWARMPPVKISVSGDFQRIQKTLQSLTQTMGDNVCTPGVIEGFRESSMNSASLVQSGAVTVKVDKGDALVPESVVDALQSFALDLFDKLLAERFLEPADEPPGGPALQFDEPARDTLQPRAALRYRPWACKLWPAQTGRYKLRETLNESETKLEIVIDRSQVVEWPTGGSGTLETMFAGATEYELKRHVVEVRADEFDTLGVTVRALCDFDKQPVQAVEIETEYRAADEHGEERVVPGSFTFRSGETAAQRFDPALVGRKREYRFRYRVVGDDGSATEPTPWVTTTNRSLNVAVANPSQIALEVSAASLNFDVVRSVRVDLSYANAGAPLQRSFELNKLTPVRKWEQAVTGALAGKVEAHVTYFLADDKVVDGTPLSTEAGNSLMLVPPPQVDVLNVMLLPSGNWSDVAQAIVQMKYRTPDGRVYDRSFRFTAMDQSAEWTVLLRDPTQRRFSYQTVVSYKSGGSDETPWTDADGDQTVRIDVKGPPRWRVNVLPTLIDFARTPAVQVSIVFQDERRTLAFTAAQAAGVDLPLPADGRKEYGYEIVWFLADGSSVNSGPQRSGATELVLPRAVLPKAGKLDIVVRGFAVDYAATPFVDVALEWPDTDPVERKSLVLSKDQPNASWSVDAGDRSQRRYRYAVTYNLANGNRVAGASGDTEDPVVSIPRFAA